MLNSYFRSLLVFVVAMRGQPLVADDSLDSVIRFTNRDVLPGSVESIDADHLVWKSPALEKPTTFDVDGVLEIRQVAERLRSDARHEALVKLTNGDFVRGQLASVGAESIALDTGFAGRLAFNRLMVASVMINELAKFVFEGPSGLDGWRQSGESLAWRYRHSGMTSNAAGGIARDVGLPDECRIAFDAAWNNGLGLRVIFFSNDIGSNHPSRGYEMTFQQRSVYIRKCDERQFIGHTLDATELEENQKARIEIRASSKSGKVCLLVDERVVEVWTDSDPRDDLVGRSIHFIAPNDSPVCVSNIQISEWDGEAAPIVHLPPPVEGELDTGVGDESHGHAAAPVVAGGLMNLRNGDTIAGEVLAIDHGVVKIKTTFKEVDLPLERLYNVALKPASLERCKRQKGDVRATFPDGSCIVFHPDGMDEEYLWGSSQNFGRARFKLAAFERVEFNIYDLQIDEARRDDPW